MQTPLTFCPNCSHQIQNPPDLSGQVAECPCCRAHLRFMFMATPTMVQPATANTFVSPTPSAVPNIPENLFAIDTGPPQKVSSPTLESEDKPNWGMIILILSIMFPGGAAWLLSGGRTNLNADLDKSILYQEAYNRAYNTVRNNGDLLWMYKEKNEKNKQARLWACEEMPTDVGRNAEQKSIYIEAFTSGYHDAIEGNRRKHTNKYSYR